MGVPGRKLQPSVRAVGTSLPLSHPSRLQTLPYIFNMFALMCLVFGFGFFFGFDFFFFFFETETHSYCPFIVKRHRLTKAVPVESQKLESKHSNLRVYGSCSH